MNKPNNLITIKKIKDILIQGTSVNFNHGEFIKMLLVDGSAFFSEEEFEITILDSTALIGFVNGNLRKNAAWGYAISNATKKIKRRELENNGSLLSTFSFAYENTILNRILKNIDDLEQQYTSGVYTRIKTLIAEDNVYYTELFNELSEKIEYKSPLSEILALLSIIAIFQDNIYKIYPKKYKTRWSDNGFFPFHPNITTTSDSNDSKANIIPISTISLFETALSETSNLGKITEIDMAFHSGHLWRWDEEQTGVLSKIIEKKIKLKIIVNTAETVHTICLHMSHPLHKYIGFDESAESWFELARQYPEQISIRIANLPLFHRTYIIKGENNIKWANIKYYTYGNFYDKKNQKFCYSSNDSEYQLLEDEFNYIWNSISSDFQSTHSFPSNVLPSKLENMLIHDDTKYISFITDILKDKTCVELNILSLLAYYCMSGELSRLIKKRLADDTNFSLRMILPNPDNIENFKKWYPNFEPILMSNFSIFCSWCKEYPNRFQLHYTDLPITERLYINQSKRTMLVDRISIPRDTNFSVLEIIDSKISDSTYKIYENQFESIWNNYSINVTDY